jgi:hypothetical protein
MNVYNDQYGFRWGLIKVERTGAIERRKGAGKHRTLTVIIGKPGEVPYHEVDIHVSPTGRSVRIYLDHRELT